MNHTINGGESPASGKQDIHRVNAEAFGRERDLERAVRLVLALDAAPHTGGQYVVALDPMARRQLKQALGDCERCGCKRGTIHTSGCRYA